MKDGLRVCIAQWLSLPGNVEANVEVALGLIEQASAEGADLVVLPELWSMGYDPDQMSRNAREAAEVVDGPTIQALCATAQKFRLWIHGGTLPELDGTHIFNTASLINREGHVIATHRKFKPYPVTGEHLVFSSGTGITVVEDEELGRVGLVTCFDGDFPETQTALAQAELDLVIEPAAYDLPGYDNWDLWYRAHALSAGQFWIMAGQCGVNPSASLLGFSQVIDPRGHIVARGPGCDGSVTPAPTLIHAKLVYTEDIKAAITYAELLRSCGSR